MHIPQPPTNFAVFKKKCDSIDMAKLFEIDEIRQMYLRYGDHAHDFQNFKAMQYKNEIHKSVLNKNNFCESAFFEFFRERFLWWILKYCDHELVLNHIKIVGQRRWIIEAQNMEKQRSEAMEHLFFYKNRNIALVEEDFLSRGRVRFYQIVDVKRKYVILNAIGSNDWKQYEFQERISQLCSLPRSVFLNNKIKIALRDERCLYIELEKNFKKFMNFFETITEYLDGDLYE